MAQCERRRDRPKASQPGVSVIAIRESGTRLNCVIIRANEEKYFYSQLLKYREENLENMQSAPGAIGYSASDHQHLTPSPSHERTPSSSVHSRVGGHGRSRSQYSVVGNEHLYSRHSFFEIAPSEASYDPFRASREPVNHTKNGLTNVTIHRAGSRASSSMKPRLSSQGNRASSLRVEAVRRRTSRRSSGLSSRTGSVKAVSHRSSMSRTSLQSGHWLGNPSIATMRPSSLHKRGVSFSHLRGASTGNARAPCVVVECQTCTPERRLRSRQAHTTSDFPPTPSPQHPSPAVKSKKEKKQGKALVNPTPRTKKFKAVAEEDVRKASVEIEKACEEAFYRSSISSSVRTSITDKPSPYSDTPPSSLSNAPAAKLKVHFRDRIDLANRPLPPTPHEARVSRETPHSYTSRELAELRNRLALKFSKDGVATQDHYNDILKQLDSLMSSDARGSGDSRRVVSAPQPSPGQPVLDPNSHLQVIPEEGRFADSEDAPGRSSRYYGKHRAATDSFIKTNPDKTIRIVPPSSPPSPTPWAPLNIRKIGDGSSTGGAGQPKRASQTSTSSRGTWQTSSTSDHQLKAVKTEDDLEIDALGAATPSKKSSISWFRRGDGGKAKVNETQTKVTTDDRSSLASKMWRDDRTARRDERYLDSPKDFEVSDAAREAAIARGTYRSGIPDYAKPNVTSAQQTKRGFFDFFKPKPSGRPAQPAHTYAVISKLCSLFLLSLTC
jgi:serine/threonine-protein kinase HSL1, negative regulator of Swe1 kinase